MGKEFNSRREFEAYIQKKALQEPAFRKELMANTKEVIRRELAAKVEEGVQIPANIQMTVVEETPSHLYLVLPQVPASVKDELSDEELEAVAGGAISLVVGVVVAVGAGAVTAAAAANTAGAVNVVAAVEEVETAVNVHHQVNVK